jgi:hypothetical protein
MISLTQIDEDSGKSLAEAMAENLVGDHEAVWMLRAVIAGK